MDIAKLKAHLDLTTDRNPGGQSDILDDGSLRFDQSNFGNTIRRLRGERRWTLRELSKKSDISQSTLSRVETGQITLSFDRAHALARALGVGFSQFLLNAKQTDVQHALPAKVAGWKSISRRGEGQHVVQDNFDFEYLCVDYLYRRMVTGIAIVRAHSLEEHGPFVSHPGEEFLHVLKGSITACSEYYAPVLLKQGDSMQFDSMTPHAYYSASKADAHVLFTVSDPRW